MSIRGIVLMAIALCALIVNYSSRRISEKTGIAELSVKISALIVVLVCVVLLMIFGK